MGKIMNIKRVYIIDNDAVTLNLYSELLVSDSYTVVPLNSYITFFREFREDVPSCVLVDGHLLCTTSIDLYHDMKSKGIDIPTIFMSSEYEVKSVVELFREGAYDCIGKNYYDCITLRDKITSALVVSEKSCSHKQRNTEYVKMVSQLTERESDILTLLSSGLTAKVIARQLKISYRTVETHVANMRTKTKMDTAHLVNNTIYQQMNTLRNK